MAATPLERLAELGLALPPASVPSANYVAWKRAGVFAYISGQVSVIPGGPSFIGRVGDGMDRQQGYEAARIACLNAIAQLAVAADGLENVTDIVKVSGFVHATAALTDHPFVMNGASDLLVAVFGEAGRHTRFAVGAASLPRGVAVELDLIAMVSGAETRL